MLEYSATRWLFVPPLPQCKLLCENFQVSALKISAAPSAAQAAGVSLRRNICKLGFFDSYMSINSNSFHAFASAGNEGNLFSRPICLYSVILRGFSALQLTSGVPLISGGIKSRGSRSWLEEALKTSKSRLMTHLFPK